MVAEPDFYQLQSQSHLDPSRRLAEIQESRPASRVKIWNGTQPWLITRYDDVRSVLADPRVSDDSTDPAYPHTSVAIQEVRSTFATFLNLDAPERSFYRRVVAGEFTAARSQKCREELVQMVNKTIDDLLKLEPPVNFVEEFVLVMAWKMTARMLGARECDHEFYKTRAHTLASGASTHQEVVAASGEILVFMDNLVTDKKRQPGDDLLSRLIVNHVFKGDISHEQLVATARLLLTGGHTTTASMTALGALLLLLGPDQFGQLRADRSLIGNAFEEMLRFCTIAHIGRRRVVREVLTLAGVTIHEGEAIIADHLIANRDPRAFLNPDEFDIHRDTTGHLAFGAGPHQCLSPAAGGVLPPARAGPHSAAGRQPGRRRLERRGAHPRIRRIDVHL
ncbi:cytochrome P450 [Streptomyces sp. NPDC002619]|uniref:cytochrome P450 n=1 Tax=Streptomyces sp. NPDC002619 TaxID=3364655 RepID=UPI0036B6C513